MEEVERLLVALQQTVGQETNPIRARLTEFAQQSDLVIARLIKALAEPGLPPPQTYKENLFDNTVALALAWTGEKVIEPLLQALNDPEPMRRIGVAQALVLFQNSFPTIRQVFKPLVEVVLRDSTPEVRETVSQVLKFTLTNPSSAIANLYLEAFNDSERQIRDRAATALGYLPPSHTYEPLNELLMQSRNGSETRRLALTALNNIVSIWDTKSRYQPYLQFISDPDEEVRFQAISLIGKLGVPAGFFTQFLNDPSEKIRLEASAIAKRESAATQASNNWLINQVLTSDTLRNQSQGIPSEEDKARSTALEGHQVAQFLVRLDELELPGAATPEMISAFTQAFFEPPFDSKKHRYAARGLQKIGLAARSLTPRLIQTVTDSRADSQLRESAADLLFDVGSRDEATVNLMVEILNDTSNPYRLRRSAAYALGNLGPVLAGFTVPVLVKVFTDSANEVTLRRATVDSLAKLVKPDGVSTITKLFKETLEQADLELGLGIAVALHKLEPAYTPAVDYVINASDKVKPENLDTFLPVLGEFGLSARPAIPNLVRLLTRPELEDKRGFAALLPFTLAKIDLGYGKEQLQQLLNELDKTSEAATHIKLTLMLMNTLGRFPPSV